VISNKSGISCMD